MRKSSMKTFTKLLLCAAFAGNDMVVSFIQLYEVPLLQELGVPISWVSLYPLMSAPLCVLTLTCLGRFRSDIHHAFNFIIIHEFVIFQ